MKFLTLIFMSLLTVQASAGYECATPDGKTKLEIGGSWQIGSTATLSSVAVKDYYLSNHGIAVKALKTVIDPSTRKAVSEVETNSLGQVVYNFMQQASPASTSTVWGLEFNSSLGLAVLTDQEGKQFQWNFNCKRIPDLE